MKNTENIENDSENVDPNEMEVDESETYKVFTIESELIHYNNA